MQKINVYIAEETTVWATADECRAYVDLLREAITRRYPDDEVSIRIDSHRGSSSVYVTDDEDNDVCEAVEQIREAVWNRGSWMDI